MSETVRKRESEPTADRAKACGGVYNTPRFRTLEAVSHARSESDHQIALVEKCRQYAWRTTGTTQAGPGLIFAIPNGGLRSKSQAARLKAEGVRSGVSDLFLPVPNAGFHGLWIELKCPGTDGEKCGQLSKQQTEWLFLMTEQGYEATVCYGVDDAWRVVCRYLGLKF